MTISIYIMRKHHLLLTKQNQKEVRGKKPSSLLKKAIQGMLPKNRLGRVLVGNFRIYDDNKHPHAAQNPETISI